MSHDVSGCTGVSAIFSGFLGVLNVKMNSKQYRHVGNMSGMLTSSDGQTTQHAERTTEEAAGGEPRPRPGDHV